MSEADKSEIVLLVDQHCSETATLVTPEDIAQWRLQIPGWKIKSDVLYRRFAFQDFHETMAFVNALAWIAHAENHHPDLAVGYGRCEVRFSTHSVGGLSENDFICAAKVDRMFGRA